MAAELGLQARMARQKLKTSLALLNNASIRTAEKVRAETENKKTLRINPEVTYDVRNWIPTYIFFTTLFLFLTIEAYK